MPCGRALGARPRPAWRLPDGGFRAGPTHAVLERPGDVIGLRALPRSWRARVAVVGDSMAPTLRPGDWLLADPGAYRRRGPRVGELVLLPDPRQPARLLVKRVAGVGPDRRLAVEGDNPEASTDSRTFGAVDPRSLEGQPWFRYWPPGRIGRLR